MSYSYGPSLVKDGLVLCLDAANPKSYVSGSAAWIDMSGNNNNGTLINGPTYTTASKGGIMFDSINDYVEIANSPSLNPTGVVTLCSFFKVNSKRDNYAPIIFKQNTRTGYYEQYSLGVDTTANVLFTVMSNTAGTQYATSTPYTLGTTIFGAAVLNVTNGYLKLYKNGVLANSVSMNISFDISTEPVRIGAAIKDYTAWTQGTIYTAQIYNRELSANEVLQNYNATKGRYNL